MKQYKVVEIARQIVQRERYWEITAVSEQDAIRKVADQLAPEGYTGEHRILIESEHVGWKVDDEMIEYNPDEAEPVEDEFTDIGGHH